MPKTKGAGNPDWTREETILALELLFRHGRPLDKRHADVIELSSFLRSAEVHPRNLRKDNFRNPDGVALKLQNLLSAVEPGRGLSYSITDRLVVNEFPRTQAMRLAELAMALRISLRKASIEEPLPADETFSEGAWLTSRHRFRDQRLRRRLLAKYQTVPLTCEVCDFCPGNHERDIRESFFEAHHKVPLATAEHQRSTKVSDMALLCACCHRFIHRLIAREGRWVGIDEARASRIV